MLHRYLPRPYLPMKDFVRVLCLFCAHLVFGSPFSGFLYGASAVQIENVQLVGSLRKVGLSVMDAARLFPGRAVPQMQKFNGGGAIKIEQKKCLKFTIQNSATKTAEGFTVRYLIVGRDLKAKKEKILESAEVPVTLNPRQQKEFVSNEITAEYYTDSGNSSGVKVVGHAIQVHQGNQMVAESYSQDDFKMLFASVTK
jgi:hypothetical protein